jgi:hypothetical protein
MFEDFRKLADEPSYVYKPKGHDPFSDLVHEDGNYLGLTPAQRFILALLFLIMIVILGVFFLLSSFKIALPFLG